MSIRFYKATFGPHPTVGGFIQWRPDGKPHQADKNPVNSYFLVCVYLWKFQVSLYI